MALTSRNTVFADKDVHLMLECSDTDLSSVNCETDSDHSVDDVSVIDTLVNGDDDYNKAVAASAENFVWERMSNCTGQTEQFIGGFVPQGAAKEVKGIFESFELFFNREFVKKIEEETNRYAIQFQNSRRRLFPRGLIVHAWKPTTAEEIYILLGLFMLMGNIQKHSLQKPFQHQKNDSYTGFWSHHNKRETGTTVQISTFFGQ
jgi:hypothetical protein